MDKFALPKGKEMSDAAYIADAAVLSKKLTCMKARGPGDTENVNARCGSSNMNSKSTKRWVLVRTLWHRLRLFLTRWTRRI